MGWMQVYNSPSFGPRVIKGCMKRDLFGWGVARKVLPVGGQVADLGRVQKPH